MLLHRLQLRPLSPWRTPWQADTLTGMLLATCARVYGSEVLRERLIAPMLGGDPPFVFSDAFPGDSLPVPTQVRLQNWPADQRKPIKNSRWMTPEGFHQVRMGQPACLNHLILLSPVLEHAVSHNTLARDTDASLSGQGPFSRPDWHLRPQSRSFLTLYVRFKPEVADILLDLLHELALGGFGADTATGRGQFEIAGDPRLAPDLEQSPPGANGLITLSTFQPAPHDPTDGLWETFPKFPKVGPDLGLPDVRKHTLILFRPGACFRADPARRFLGHAIPMRHCLPAPVSNLLSQRGINLIHPAFALTVPAALSWN